MARVCRSLLQIRCARARGTQRGNRPVIVFAKGSKRRAHPRTRGGPADTHQPTLFSDLTSVEKRFLICGAGTGLGTGLAG